MKIHPIQAAFEDLPQSIKNTASDYIEGRDILIYCLSRSSKRTGLEVIEWLESNGISVKDLRGFKDIFKENIKEANTILNKYGQVRTQ